MLPIYDLVRKAFNARVFDGKLRGRSLEQPLNRWTAALDGVRLTGRRHGLATTLANELRVVLRHALPVGVYHA